MTKIIRLNRIASSIRLLLSCDDCLSSCPEGEELCKKGEIQALNGIGCKRFKMPDSSYRELERGSGF